MPIKKSFPWASGHKGKNRAFAKLVVVSEKAKSHGSELAFTNNYAFHKMSVFFRLNANVA